MSLVCSRVSFSYGERVVLRDVDFSVPPGTFCALLGQNGSGKTTLLHCLNGLLRPQQGSVEIDGCAVGRTDRKTLARRVSLVSQDHGDIFPFSVIDVVVMGRTAYLGVAGGPGEKDYAAAHDTLKYLGMEALGDRNFNQISGGERQIALLARALVQSSRTLLLDEPTNHLDFKNQYTFLSRIKTLCRERGTRVIAAMHDPNLAQFFADQVIMLKDGGVMARGPAAEVMGEAQISRLYGTEARRFELATGLQVFIPSLVFAGRSGIPGPGPCVVIVTGSRHSGKSTLVEQAIRDARTEGVRFAGIFARGYWQDGRRGGFDLIDLSDGSCAPLARRTERPCDGTRVPFEFFEQGIEAGERALSPERCRLADVVVLDELGKLEAQGLGWAPHVDPLLALGRPLYLWVVRSDLLETIVGRWNLKDPEIVSVGEPDAAGRLLALLKRASGKG